MINKKKFVLLILLLASLLNNLAAKENDFCVWIDLAATKKIRSATFGLLGEIYTRQNSTTLERVSFGLKGDYSFFHWLSAGAGFLLMEYKLPGTYELRDRFYFQAEPSWHLNNYYFEFRERMQITQYPESPTKISDNKIWRNRFEVCYRNSSWKLDPMVNIETLHLFNNKDLRFFNEVRVQMGANCHLTKNQIVKCYGMFTENTFQNRFILGVAYEIKI